MYKILVLTGYADIFNQFQESVNKYEPKTECIVVKNKGLDLCLTNKTNYTVLDGIDPFIIARNLNIGVKAAGDSDVLICNDDIQFLRENSISDLQHVAYMTEKMGIVSPAIIGGVCNPLQRYKQGMSRFTVTYSDKHLASMCIYLKRSVINRVGLFDEQYDKYGGDDVDYCIRAQKEGYKLAITNKTVVQHGFNKSACTSSFSRVGSVTESIKEMDIKLHNKFGADYALPKC